MFRTRFRGLVAAITTTALLLLAAPPANAAATPAQIVSNLQLLAEKAQSLQSTAQSINIVNGPLIVIGQGPYPTIIAGFTDMNSTDNSFISSLPGTAPIPAGADADAVFTAYSDHVRALQTLLNILIGKSGLFSTVPVIGEPVTAVLRQTEAAEGTLAFALEDLIVSRSSDFQNQANSLSVTLEVAIRAYSGI